MNDEFNRADSIDLGSNWDSGYDSFPSCAISGNVAQVQAQSDVCIETWNANTFTNNQWAQVTLVTFAPAGTDIGRIALSLHATGPGPTRTMYVVKARHGDPTASTNMFKIVADVQTTLATENSITWVSGDILYFEISGTTLTAKRNGVTVFTATDSDLASGRIGLEIDEGGSDLTLTQADSFSGGDLATVGRHRTGPMAFQ